MLISPYDNYNPGDWTKALPVPHSHTVDQEKRDQELWTITSNLPLSYTCFLVVDYFTCPHCAHDEHHNVYFDYAFANGTLIFMEKSHSSQVRSQTLVPVGDEDVMDTSSTLVANPSIKLQKTRRKRGRFTQEAALIKHLKKFHMRSYMLDDKPGFQCLDPGCRLKFCDFNDLWKHMWLNHSQMFGGNFIIT